MNPDALRPPGVVVALLLATRPACEHDRVTLDGFVRTMADLKGWRAAAAQDPAAPLPAPVYFMPNDTLTLDQAAALGIHGPGDLFGGVVPHAFVATKAISHPLIAPQAACPAGWDPQFARRSGGSVLAGYTAFSREDARLAARQLLQAGPVRLKPVRASGGSGQAVACEQAVLEDLLRQMDAGEIAAHGLVLEQHLDAVRTFSVGQVQVDDLLASYYGLQQLTPSNSGEEVFGGSDLVLARGDFDALLALQPPPQARRAIEQARRFDAAVRACYAGFFASRSNYDVALGRDVRGRWCCGVLEQSWRVGGATGPELAALQAFRREPLRQRVRARSIEVYGDSPEPPPHATVHFRGTDPQVGALTKYTVVEPDVHPS